MTLCPQAAPLSECSSPACEGYCGRSKPYTPCLCTAVEGHEGHVHSCFHHSWTTKDVEVTCCRCHRETEEKELVRGTKENPYSQTAYLSQYNWYCLQCRHKNAIPSGNNPGISACYYCGTFHRLNT